MIRVIRSIDVGYGNTKILISPTAAPPFDCFLIPSVAVASRPSQPTAPLGTSRRTINLRIDGLIYEAGPDARLAQGPAWLPNMHDEYCLTPEYLALIRTALHYIREPVIELLVLGLPVSTYRKRRVELEARMTGDHPLTAGHVVRVNEVRVVPQPCGALMHFLKHTRRSQARSQRNLVIDAGSRTFDWVVADGSQVRDELCGAVNRGMYDVLDAIARGINEAEGITLRDLDRIDTALRTGHKPLLFGKEYDLTPFLASARKTAEEAVATIKRYVDDGSDVDNIVCSGGATFFYLPAVQEAFPRHAVHAIEEAVFANVRGFQSSAEALAMLLDKGPRPSQQAAA